MTCKITRCRSPEVYNLKPKAVNFDPEKYQVCGRGEYNLVFAFERLANFTTIINNYVLRSPF
jgi:hypothetical protein